MSRTPGGYYGDANNTRAECENCGAELGALVERCAWCGWGSGGRR